MGLPARLLFLALAVSLSCVTVSSSDDLDDQAFLREKISRLEEEVWQLRRIVLDLVAERTSRVNRADGTDSVAIMVNQHEQDIASLASDIADLKEISGSTFIRWGRNDCPGNVTLVYRGFVTASHYDDTASSPNRLCLTDEPEFDPDMQGDFYQRVFGAEYYVPGPNHTVVPCAVCRTTQPTTIMVPGSRNCSDGWVTQYSGYVIGHFFTDIKAAEYLCLDGEPEDADGNEAGWDTSFSMYAMISCGSIPCPPYEADQVVTCVVCSKIKAVVGASCRESNKSKTPAGDHSYNHLESESADTTTNPASTTNT